MSISKKYSSFNKFKSGGGFLGKSNSTNNYISFISNSNCEGTGEETTLYHLKNLSLTNGTIIYSDQGTSPYSNQAFFKDYYQYNTDENGAISNTARCSLQWDVHDDCNNSNPTTVYSPLESGGSLIVGLEIYEDYLLSNPFDGIFVTGGLIYNVVSGTIQTISNCLTGVSPCYSDCSLTTQNDVYINGSVPSYFSDNTRLYTNPEGTSEYGSSYIVYNGFIYNYSSGIGTSNATPCST